MNVATNASQLAVTLIEARSALRGARYDHALALLDGCEDWPAEIAERAVIVKSEVIGRREPAAALEYLATASGIAVTPIGLFEYAIQSGKAFASVRDFDAAQARLAEASAHVDALPDGRHTLAYQRARLSAFRGRDPEAADVALALAHPDRNLASAAHAQLAARHVAAGRFAENVRELIAAVTMIDAQPAEMVDVSIIGNAVYALAQAGFEMADEKAVAVARNAAERLQWTSDVRTAHFLATRALGWDAFMRGRPGHAQWAFRDARELAPSAPWKVMSHLDRAYVARMSGNAVWAIEEIAAAEAIARDIAWEASYDEGRQVLVMLATLYAPIDAARAQRYAAEYAKIGNENVDPRLNRAADKRVLGFKQYAQARIEQTLGRKDAAIALQQSAYELFSQAGYHYRAAMAATALAELTGEDAWRVRAHDHVRRYPDCPLAVVVDESIERERAFPAGLSALQRQLAQAVWSGAELRELSHRFSRSVYTLEQQLARICEAFGVASREALIVRARELGLA